MDPETERRFNTLEGAVVRLADNLNTLTGTVQELAQAQKRTDERLTLLTGTMQELAQAQKRTDESLTLLTERVDRLAQLMIRGHTEAAERHAAIIERLDELEKT